MTEGYHYSPFYQSSAVFYPLYPLLIWLVGQPLAQVSQQPYPLAAMLISWVAFGRAAVLLYRLASRRLGKATAVQAAHTIQSVAVAQRKQYVNDLSNL